MVIQIGVTRAIRLVLAGVAAASTALDVRRRGQPFGTFRVVFNSVLFGGEQTVGKAFGAVGFWTTPAADKPKP